MPPPMGRYGEYRLACIEGMYFGAGPPGRSTAAGATYVLRAGEGSAVGSEIKLSFRARAAERFQPDLSRSLLSFLWSQIQRRFDRHDDLSVRDRTL
jgi:hypothetical protein